MDQKDSPDIVEFINARLDEWDFRTAYSEYTIRIHELVEAARRILEEHKKWPVLVEGRTEMDYDRNPDSLESFHMRMTKQIAFLTQEEYVRTFGRTPPTAPMIRALANTWRDHSDFDESWRIDE